jgi:hypothetical protein
MSATLFNGGTIWTGSQDTDDVLSDLAGLDAAALADLRRRSII